MTKNKKAFSLMEVMIGMVVVAVLISLGVAAAFRVQRASRDTARTATGGQIVDKINDYRRTNLQYPDKTSVVFNVNNILIEGESVVSLNGHLRTGSSSNTRQTRYFYDNVSGGFIFCVLLETGRVSTLGTRSCPAVSVW